MTVVSSAESHRLSRRLPVAPVPLPGESLFSWVDHLAAVYEVDRTEIMQWLGLDPRAAHASRLARHTAELRLDAARSLHIATGLEPEAIHAMTLLGVVEVRRSRPYRLSDAPEAPEETWAFCPRCVEPPVRWPLWWYRWWAVMCPEHNCYTVSFCPDCGSPFSPAILRGDAPGHCPGFTSLADEQHRAPGRRRPKRKRCGRPLWEILTPTVADPMVRDTHQRLVRMAGEEPSSLDRQWYDDLRTLRILLNEPNPLYVQTFTGPDPALRERYTTQERGSMWDDTDTNPVVLRATGTGFLHPWRRTSPSTYGKERDPVTTGAELSVIASVLASDDMAAAAREAFRVLRPASLRDFDNDLPPYLYRASSQLHALISQAQTSDVLNRLHASPEPPRT
ncbi:TniQ family protein [Streptomyces alanosinicus]|uniref:TniQ domain-containing protein n=1 Tax=Streptomyces alanosinicus TaxID=68171 RepID=A0A919D444_9ACTN|nr:TniQ family protein [Streptomyces alanosinicus]GHE08754.1 hypothetical protein GCM10010339_58760 [Streptomyces alanosinicus]